MKKLAPLLLILIAAFCTINVHSQLKIQTGEQFLAGTEFEKIHVCVEDHSVWALNKEGKLFFKKNTALDFSVYPLTANSKVTNVTGFNANEMFFLSENKVFFNDNNVLAELTVPFSGITRINDISVAYNKDHQASYNSGLSLKDYLAIATNNSYFYVIRGDKTATIQHVFANPHFITMPDSQFGYTGFKALTYRYLSPQSYCFDVDRLTETNGFGYTRISWIPDKGLYNRVNTAIVARSFYDPFNSTSEHRSTINVWGSTNGMFFANWATCFNNIVHKRLDNEYVNDMEEIYALTPIFKQDYFITATNTGIYYTPESIFAVPMNDPNFAKFVKLDDFPTQRVNAVATETDNLGVFSHGQDKYYSLCERIVWAAGEKGIYKLYLSLDQDYYNTFKWGDFFYSKPSNSTDFETPSFEICGNEELKVTTKIPTTFTNQILIKWFKDDTEIPGSIGKLEMSFKETGIYTAKITSLCENITVTTYPISVKYNMGPEITFTPPENVVICNNLPYVMETKNVTNYTYQWYKDEQKIVGATQFRYQTITDGKYRVEVSNNSCLSTQSSTSVALKFLNIPTPQIVKDKSTYCIGDVAKLSISNQDYQTKWFKDGIELTAFANQNQMETALSGIYRVDLVSKDCAKSSLELPITFNPIPTVTITRSNTKILCYGETVDLATNLLPNASYLWSNGETTPSITVKEAGKYFVVVTNANNCSSKSNEVDVIVNEDLRYEQPEIQSLKVDYCVGEEAQLSVKNVQLWPTKWFLDNKELTEFSNKNQITTTKPGKYRVVFLNGLSCEKTSPELAISFNNKLSVEIRPTTNTSICFGESITLSAGRFTNAIYEWSTGEKTESILVKQSGTYSVKVISQFGCATLSQPVEIVVNPIPKLIANEQLQICASLNEQVELKAETGYVRYTWSSSAENTSNIKVSKPGLYSVQVEDGNGCKAIKSFEVTAYCKEILAPNAFSPNDDGVNDVWTIAGLETDPNASLQIFNRMGTIIYTTRGSTPSWNGKIGTINAPIGTYYYIILSNVLKQNKNGILTLIR